MGVPSILLVTGPPGAGKTSVARELAGRFEPSVHLQTDLFYAAISRGFIPPWKVDAERQNKTVVRAAARAAAPYASAAYATFVDGVVLPWALEIYREELAKEAVEVRCAVLLPEVDEVVRRGLSRTDDHGLDETVYREMHRQFVEMFEGKERIFRKTTSVLETANSILAAQAPS